MKHIKHYKIFESSDDVLDDIKDICLELEDKGFTIQYLDTPIINGNESDYNVILIEKKVNSTNHRGVFQSNFTRVAYNFVEVEEVANRIKEVLGYRYISSSFRPRRSGGEWIVYDTPGHNFVDNKVIGVMIKYRNGI